MRDYKKQINNYLNQEINVLKQLDLDAINQAMNELERARKEGNTVYICGNGGSASTASHFTGDFNKGVSVCYEQKYNFVCLSDNIASMMAIANDVGYDDIFKLPLEGRIKKGDILIAISGSGNSENVVKAIKCVKECGNTVIGVTGYSGGKVKELSDINLHVPVDNMQITEDVHLIFNHLMMHILAYGQKDE